MSQFNSMTYLMMQHLMAISSNRSRIRSDPQLNIPTDAGLPALPPPPIQRPGGPLRPRVPYGPGTGTNLPGQGSTRPHRTQPLNLRPDLPVVFPPMVTGELGDLPMQTIGPASRLPRWPATQVAEPVLTLPPFSPNVFDPTRTLTSEQLAQSLAQAAVNQGLNTTPVEPVVVNPAVPNFNLPNMPLLVPMASPDPGNPGLLAQGVGLVFGQEAQNQTVETLTGLLSGPGFGVGIIRPPPNWVPEGVPTPLDEDYKGGPPLDQVILIRPSFGPNPWNGRITSSGYGADTFPVTVSPRDPFGPQGGFGGPDPFGPPNSLQQGVLGTGLSIQLTADPSLPPDDPLNDPGFGGLGDNNIQSLPGNAFGGGGLPPGF